MKKLLLTIAIAIAPIVPSSIAFGNIADTFYLQIGAGAGYFNPIRDRTTGYQLKSDVNFSFLIGAGYNILENARIDVLYFCPYRPEQKKIIVDTFTSYRINPKIPTSFTETEIIKHKAIINAFLVNAYVDLFDVRAVKFYAGIGLGFAQVKEKLTHIYQNTLYPYFSFEQSASSKNKTNIAYRVTLGGELAVSPSIILGVAYDYIDYGITKSWKTHRDEEISKTHYKGHDIVVTVRYNF